MTAAARVAPKHYFSIEEWAPLARRSAWKGPALTAHAWLVILAAAAMAMAFPITIPLAVMIIGARQLGLAILMHDAARDAARLDRLNEEVARIAETLARLSRGDAPPTIPTRSDLLGEARRHLEHRG